MSVNYLIEIVSLDDWELTHPLTATAYKLMRKLLHLANKERFPRTISVPNSTLISMVGCSEDSLSRARNQLIQEGLIKYKGQKRMRPLYEIQYFSDRTESRKPDICGLNDNNPKFAGFNAGFPTGFNAGFPAGFSAETYINKNKRETREEDTANADYTGDARAMPFADAAFMPRETRELRGIQAFLDQLQRTPHAGLFAHAGPMQQLLSGRYPLPLVGEALERTVERHRRYPLADGAMYALQLLVDWTSRGLTTPEDVRESRDDYGAWRDDS